MFIEGWDEKMRNIVGDQNDISNERELYAYFNQEYV